MPVSQPERQKVPFSKLEMINQRARAAHVDSQSREGRETEAEAGTGAET